MANLKCKQHQVWHIFFKFLPNKICTNMDMKMERLDHKRWKQRRTDSIYWQGQAKDEAHFSMGTQWRLHCRSLKSPSNASLGLRRVEWGRVNKGWVYAIPALVHFVLFFFSFPHQNIFFSVCIKCQVNFLGAMRDVSSPSVCVAGWWIVSGCFACRCVYVCVSLCVCACLCLYGWMGKGKGAWQGKERDERWWWGVQYSMYKLVLSEELERCVESVHACVCMQVCLVV